MRYIGPILGIALLLSLEGQVPAQVPVTFDIGAKPATIQYKPIQPVLPNINPVVNRSMMGPQANPRLFDFSKLIPNVSFLNSRWPIRRSYSKIDPKHHGPFVPTPQK